MDKPGDHQKKILYLIVCAAPPASHSSELIASAQQEGWDVCVVATPEATKFIDAQALESQTGHVVRSEYKHPGSEDTLPQPDAIVVVPATFNTINKWAQGIADTLAVSVLCEHLGKGTRIVAVPYLKADLAAHPAFPNSISLLKKYGVRLMHNVTKDGSAFMPQGNDILAEVIAVKTAISSRKRRRESNHIGL